jgi:hypothetical protein
VIRRALAAIATLAAVWALAVRLSGGFAVSLAGLQLSSSDATRPLMWAVLADLKGPRRTIIGPRRTIKGPWAFHVRAVAFAATVLRGCDGLTSTKDLVVTVPRDMR